MRIRCTHVQTLPGPSDDGWSSREGRGSWGSARCCASSSVRRFCIIIFTFCDSDACSRICCAFASVYSRVESVQNHGPIQHRYESNNMRIAAFLSSLHTQLNPRSNGKDLASWNRTFPMFASAALITIHASHPRASCPMQLPFKAVFDGTASFQRINASFQKDSFISKNQFESVLLVLSLQLSQRRNESSAIGAQTGRTESV